VTEAVAPLEELPVSLPCANDGDNIISWKVETDTTKSSPYLRTNDSMKLDGTDQKFSGFFFNAAGRFPLGVNPTAHFTLTIACKEAHYRITRKALTLVHDVF
jgi:hypothetical protein